MINHEREGWAEWPEQDPETLREMYIAGTDWFKQALDLLASHAPQRLTYPEVNQLLGWHAGRFRSVLGGWKSRRGENSTRPYHICPPWLSRSGEWEAWMDERQAAAIRGNATTGSTSPPRDRLAR